MSTRKLTFGVTVLAAGLLACTSQSRAQQAFGAGDLVVDQVGTTGSTTALSSVGTAVYLSEYSTQGGALVQSFQLGGSSNPFTQSGSASSEGALSRSADGSSLIVAGYNAAVGTTGVASSTSIAREIGVISANGSQNTNTTLGTSFSGNNIRSAASPDGNALYAVGGTTGVVNTTLNSTGNGTIVSTTSTNNRVTNLFTVGGTSNLYFSTGSGTRGIYQVGTGLPTAAGTTATQLIATGTTSSPYGFSISPDGLTAYVADDRSTTTANTGGVEKFTRTSTGSAFALAYTFSSAVGATTTGARGLTVDYTNYNTATGNGAILYATTADASANNLITFTDAGVASAATVLETAGANTVFRGVDFAPAATTPVPEPATWLAGGLTALLLGWSQRRRIFAGLNALGCRLA